jgi:AraC-like DNA-binding protein
MDDPWGREDPLGEALHLVRMSGAFYSRGELSEPWGMELIPVPGYLWFHVVATGRAEVVADGAEPLALGPGELALVPHGEGHVLRSDASAEPRPILELDREELGERYEVVRAGGGGAPARLVCAAVRFDHPAALDLVRALPRVLKVDSQAEWLHSTVRLMAGEVAARRPGGEAVITRLTDVLVVQAIRSWLDTDPAARTGWLGALQDPQIGRAIALVHREPARDWTLASLAREVAMSRSAFAARFTELVGEPAMRYVARRRMHLAAAALRDEGATVGEVADRFGYRSEGAFSRAFKRVMGVPPGAVRRGALAPPPIPAP